MPPKARKDHQMIRYGSYSRPLLQKERFAFVGRGSSLSSSELLRALPEEARVHQVVARASPRPEELRAFVRMHMGGMNIVAQKDIDATWLCRFVPACTHAAHEIDACPFRHLLSSVTIQWPLNHLTRTIPGTDGAYAVIAGNPMHPNLLLRPSDVFNAAGYILLEARDRQFGVRFVQRTQHNDLDLPKGKRATLAEDSTTCANRESSEEGLIDLSWWANPHNPKNTLYIQDRSPQRGSILALSGVIISPTAFVEDYAAPKDAVSAAAAAEEIVGTQWVSMKALYREVERGFPLALCDQGRGDRPVYSYAAMILRFVAHLLAGTQEQLTLHQFTQALYNFARLGTQAHALCRANPADAYCFGRHCLSCRNK